MIEKIAATINNSIMHNADTDNIKAQDKWLKKNETQK